MHLVGFTMERNICFKTRYFRTLHLVISGQFVYRVLSERAHCFITGKRCPPEIIIHTTVNYYKPIVYSRMRRK